MDVKTVSQDEYTGKKGETSEIHIPVDSMSLYQQQQDGGTFMSRTMTQDDFGPKVGEREKPVVHASELSLTEPNGMRFWG